MSRTKNNTQEKKMRTSKVVMASPLLSIFGVCLLVLILYWKDAYKFFGLSLIPFYLTRFYVYGHFISGLMVAAGIAIGILFIKKGKNDQGTSKTGQCAIVGIIIGAVFFVFWIFHSHGSTFTAQKRCAANLRSLGKWMILYAGDYDEQYPRAEKWCDLLTEYMRMAADNRVIEKCFICPANKEGRCHYAMNPNLSSRSQPGLVLLFETEAGWNQFGGPEILTAENHHGKGCNILFNDSHVEFVKADKISELKWTISKNNNDE